MELEKLTETGGLNTDRLAEIVRNDPIVSMRVLRRVNSSYWGIRREVSDVDHAARLLGFRAVYELALVEGMRLVRKSITAGPAQDIFDLLMEISTFAAYFGQHFTSSFEVLEEARGRVFSAGLLHTAGRLVLLYSKPTAYVGLCAASPTPLPEASREKQSIGIDHQKVNEEACRHWSLPPDLTKLVSFYYRPQQLEEERDQTLASLVATAGHFALQSMTGEDPSFPAVFDFVERDRALQDRPVRDVATQAAARAEEAIGM